jgi:hypothetical protein
MSDSRRTARWWRRRTLAQSETSWGFGDERPLLGPKRFAEGLSRLEARGVRHAVWRGLDVFRELRL